MAEVLKRVKIVNPGRRKVKRKASPAQLAARAKFAAMVRAKAKNPGKKRRAARRKTSSALRISGAKNIKYRSDGSWNARLSSYNKSSKARGRDYKAPDRSATGREYITNPGEIITIGLNPGVVRKRKKVNSIMARRKRVSKRRNFGLKRRVIRRRRSNPSVRRRRVYRRRSNPVARRRRRYARRSNPGIMRRIHRRIRRRRNPDFGGLKSTGMTVLGLIGGAAITKMVTDRLPASLTNGFMKYLTVGAIATILGYGVGKFSKNAGLGSSMALGGYTLLGLQLLNDFVPGFSGYVPFGLKGMGMIAPSSFYTPQVGNAGSITSFVTPSAVNAAIAAAMPVQKGMRGLDNRTRMTRV